MNDLLITGAIAKRALFIPVFVPLSINFSVAPEAVLAAYRVTDSPAVALATLEG